MNDEEWDNYDNNIENNIYNENPYFSTMGGVIIKCHSGRKFLKVQYDPLKLSTEG